jgi:poly-gamma-glutamate synthesis protein (capsule biosynthesis protein)
MATARTERAASPLITISLCGDVMTGRGVDQILPHASDPVLYEPYVRDARDYVALAEKANGAIAKPVDYAYVWGEALREWDRVAPDVRIINLETSVTLSSRFWPGKGINYRMSPQNVPCITAAKVDCCAVANNHVLDWGYEGLAETLKTLREAGAKTAGAGANRGEAEAPSVFNLPGKGRVLMFAFGSESSGIPPEWAAKATKPGISVVDERSAADMERIGRIVGQEERERDVVVASVHWGPNWSYLIPEEQRRFAHALVDEAAVDIVYGHSSHHVKGIEVYRGHLILYGCGDFLDDYEGIAGHEWYRSDLGLLYFAGIDAVTGKLARLHMIPTQIRRMQVRRASTEDALWLKSVLNRESRAFGAWAELAKDKELVLQWDASS